MHLIQSVNNILYDKQDDRTHNSGIDYLRIVLMLMIVLHHATVYGTGLYNADKFSLQNIFAVVINSFAIVGVNCFFLISGYLRIRCSIKKILRLHILLIFYGTGIYITFCLLGLISIDWVILVKSLVFPELFYWFMMVYFIVLLFSKPINRLLDSLDVKSYVFYLILFMLIELIGLITDSRIIGNNRGYSIQHGLFMYSLGFFWSKYRAKKLRVKPIVLYMMIGSINAIMALGMIRVGRTEWLTGIFAYSNPLIIIEALAFFELFVNLKYRECATIHEIAASTLPVYIITDHIGIQKVIFIPIVYMESKFGSFIGTVTIFVYGLVLMTLCILIEMVRRSVICRIININNSKKNV